jgi:hypothetical protein
MPRFLGRISLLLTLIIGTVLELMTNRIGVHLFGASSDTPVPSLYRAIDTIGLFSFYFTGLVAIIAFAWGLVVLISDSRILALWSRLGLMLLGATFLPLAGTGLVFRLPAGLKPWMNVSFGLLVILLFIAFVQKAASIRHKLGWLYLIAPLLLHCYWLATKQMPMLAPGGVDADLPSKILVMGEHLVVVGAFATFLFFTPFPRWSSLLEPIPVILAIVVTLLVGGMVAGDYQLSIKAAFYGFGLNLPPDPREVGRLSLLVSAFFFFMLTLLSLSMRGRAERSIAVGLLLMALSGYQLELPYQLLLTLTGLIQVLRGSHALALEQAGLDAPTASPAPDEGHLISADTWKSYLLAVAAQAGLKEAEAVVLLGDRGEIARLCASGPAGDVAVRLQLQRARISQLDIEVGSPPDEEARCSLQRRQERRGERVPEGRGKKAKGFPSEFGLRDDLDLADDLGGLDLRASPLHPWSTRRFSGRRASLCRSAARRWVAHSAGAPRAGYLGGFHVLAGGW